MRKPKNYGHITYHCPKIGQAVGPDRRAVACSFFSPKWKEELAAQALKKPEIEDSLL